MLIDQKIMTRPRPKCLFVTWYGPALGAVKSPEYSEYKRTETNTKQAGRDGKRGGHHSWLLMAIFHVESLKIFARKC